MTGGDQQIVVGGDVWVNNHWEDIDVGFGVPPESIPEGRFASLRAELLPALQPRRSPRRTRRHFDEPCRLPMCRAAQTSAVREARNGSFVLALCVAAITFGGAVVGLAFSESTKRALLADAVLPEATPFRPVSRPSHSRHLR